jgi:hypothetical protein
VSYEHPKCVYSFGDSLYKKIKITEQLTNPPVYKGPHLTVSAFGISSFKASSYITTKLVTLND